MSKRKLTRRERGQIRWQKHMEPKVPLETRVERRAKQLVYTALITDWDIEDSERLVNLVKQAILLEHARGVHEGAGNPYC